MYRKKLKMHSFFNPLYNISLSSLDCWNVCNGPGCELYQTNQAFYVCGVASLYDKGIVCALSRLLEVHMNTKDWWSTLAYMYIWNKETKEL